MTPVLLEKLCEPERYVNPLMIQGWLIDRLRGLLLLGQRSRLGGEILSKVSLDLAA